MSVNIYSREEMEQIAYNAYIYAPHTKLKRLYRCVFVAGHANKLAYALTYGMKDCETLKIEKMRDETIPTSLSPEDAAKQIGLLLYNCISN